MNFDERMGITRRELTKFLSRYSPPRAMNDEAQAASFMGICTAINKRIAANVNEGVFRDRLSKIFEAVADTHETNAWPVQSVFVKAAGLVAKRTQAEGTSAGDWKPSDPLRRAIDRMQRHEAVEERFLYGPEAHEIERVVGSDLLKAYRSALFFSERNVYGEDEALDRERARKDKHERAVQ